MAANAAAGNPPGISLDNVVDPTMANDAMGMEIVSVGNRLEAVASGHVDNEAVVPILTMATQQLVRVSKFIVSMYVWARNMFGAVNQRIDDCQGNIVTHQHAMEGIINHAKEEFDRARAEVNSIHIL